MYELIGSTSQGDFTPDPSTSSKTHHGIELVFFSGARALARQRSTIAKEIW